MFVRVGPSGVALLLVICLAPPASADADRALVRAAAKGSVPEVEAALRAGAAVGVTLEVGDELEPMTPLLAAVLAGSPEAVGRLLRAGADPRQLEALAPLTAVGFNDLAATRLLIAAMGPRRPEDPSFADAVATRMPPRLICLARGSLIRGVLEATAEDDDAEVGAPSVDACLQAPQDDPAELAAVLRAAGYLGPGEDSPSTSEQRRVEFLLRAVEAGNDAQALALLADGIDPAVPAGDGRYVLPEAALLGRQEVVAALLRAGAPADAHGPEQVRALTAAAAGNRLDVARALLDGGASPRKLGDTDWPLRSAVRAGADEVAELLLARGASLAERDRRGRTLLHAFDRTDGALEGGGTRYRRLSQAHYAMPALLARHGFDFRAVDGSGRQVEVLTSVIGELNDFELLEALVAAGAPVTEQAMLQAVIEKKSDVLEWLVRKGGDPNTHSVLSDAASLADFAPGLIRVLLRAGARGPSDPGAARVLRRTLVVEGAAEALGLLVERNPPPASCPPWGGSAPAGCEEAYELVLEAVERGGADVVRVLAERHVNPASADRNGYTVLHELLDRDVRARKRAADAGKPPPDLPHAGIGAALAAVMENAPDLMRLETRWKATPRALARRNATTERWLDGIIAAAASKESELHRAVRQDDPLKVAALIAAGADLDRLDGLGRTPLTLALQLERHVIAARLLEKGAAFTLLARNGYQQADVAFASAAPLASAFLARLLRVQLLDVRGAGDETAAERVLRQFERQSGGLRADVAWSLACEGCKGVMTLSGTQRWPNLPLESDRRPRVGGDVGGAARDLFWVRQDTFGPIPFELRAWNGSREVTWFRGREFVFTVEGARRVPGCTFDFSSDRACYPEVVVENPNLPTDLSFRSTSGYVTPPAATVTVTQNGVPVQVLLGERVVFDRSLGPLDIRVGPVTSQVLGQQSVAITAGVGPTLGFDLSDFDLGRRVAVYAAIAQHLDEKARLAAAGGDGAAVRAKTLATAVHQLSAKLVRARVPVHVQDKLRSRAIDLVQLDGRLVELHRVLYANVVTPADLDQALVRIQQLLPQLAPDQRARLQVVRDQVAATRASVGNTTAGITVLQGSFHTEVERVAREYQALILEYAQYVSDDALEAVVRPADRAWISQRLLARDVVIPDEALGGRGARLRTLFGLPAPAHP